MILYREKTQIRFCINITDMGKREKMLHFEIRYRDMPFCSVKEHSERTFCCMITRNDNS